MMAEMPTRDTVWKAGFFAARNPGAPSTPGVYRYVSRD